ncbi:hypothetical protein ACFL1A_03175 [Patescibacteria group bacterium]
MKLPKKFKLSHIISQYQTKSDLVGTGLQPIKSNHIQNMKWVLLITSLLSLITYLWWHYQLGILRYFDVDEFAHLHYASHMLMGAKPYIDFQSFFPPGFAVFLMPAFSSGWGTIQPFITARIMMLFVFVGVCIFSALIFYRMRKSLWGAVFAASLLAFIPMPIDKFLEVRPDNLATLLILIGIYFQMRLMGKKRAFDGFVSGVFYSLSYIVLPKMIPNIAVGIMIALVWSLSGIDIRKRRDLVKMVSQLKPFIAGLVAPMILFVIWLLTLGDFSTVFYSLFQLPLEANKIAKYFIMMPTLFFYPNGIYYGADGWTSGLLTNHTLWIVGLFVGAIRLLTPYLAGRKEKVLSELLVASQLYIQVIFYVIFVPLRHAQYLIPIAVFVAIYVSDAALIIWKKVKTYNIGMRIYPAVFVILSIFLYQQFTSINEIKLSWTNRQLLSDISHLYAKIPVDVPVLDLDGKMLYNPDAYYACCIPFGQSAEFYSRPLPDLPQILETNQVKYINQGGLERVGTLPSAWQQYIYTNYQPLDGDKTFLVRIEK